MAEQLRAEGSTPAPSKVELSISCKNLPNTYYFSKPNPICGLFVKKLGRDAWMEIDRTEVIKNNVNPEFAKKFLVDYDSEEPQMCRFEMYNVDSNSTNLRDHDFLGRMDVSLGEIVSSSRVEKPLTGASVAEAGTISVVAAEVAGCKEEVTFRFEGKKLDKKAWFGKSDPFLTIYRVNEDNSMTVVHRTDVIKGTLNPIWSPLTIPVSSLCRGDYHRPILIRCYDWNPNGRDELIGECTTNLQSLSEPRSSGRRVCFELVNHAMKSQRGYKRSGTLVLRSVKIKKALTFLTEFIGQCVRENIGNTHVLVPLCGKSAVDIKWLYDEGFTVYGVDASQKALQAFFEVYNMQFTYTRQSSGFTVFKNQDERIRLFCGDLFHLSKDVTDCWFDAIWDRSAFVFINLQDRGRYLNVAKELLLPGGRILLSTFIYDTSKCKEPPYVINHEDVRRYFQYDFHINTLNTSTYDSLQLWQQERCGIDSLQEVGYMLSLK